MHSIIKLGQAVFMFVVFAQMSCLMGCERSSLDNYKKAVQSGRNQIHVAQEMEAIFPGQVQNFIGHSPGTLPKWNSEILLHERYVLTMQVDIQVNRGFSVVTEVVGEPKFYLWEVLSVDDGRSSRIGQNWSFGLEEWAKIVAASGDFSAIGIQLRDDQPVDGFQEMYKSVRNEREPP